MRRGTVSTTNKPTTSSTELTLQPTTNLSTVPPSRSKSTSMTSKLPISTTIKSTSYAPGPDSNSLFVTIAIVFVSLAVLSLIALFVTLYFMYWTGKKEESFHSKTQESRESLSLVSTESKTKEFQMETKTRPE